MRGPHQGADPFTAGSPPRISVLVPVTERPQRLEAFYAEFSAPLRKRAWSFEFVFVLDRKWSGEGDRLEELAASGEPIQVLRMGHSVGETVLLQRAAALARGSILMTLPAYPRIVASFLPAVIDPVLEGANVAAARRWPRRDSWWNRLQNAAFHLLLRPISEGSIHDVACGVQVFRREVFQALPLYGEFHRFLPLLALREGYHVEEVEAPQHPGDQSPRVFSPGTYLKRALDLLGLFFLVHFTDRPLRFFGLAGGISALSGAVILLFLLVERIQGQALGDRPLLLLGAIAFVVGVQAIALGLVGELIVFVNASGRRSYRILPAARREGEGEDATERPEWEDRTPSALPQPSTPVREPRVPSRPR